MRLALAQINPTIGDIAGNAAIIARFIDQARTAMADLVVFPELCLCGYPPRDLLLQEGFLDACTGHARRLGKGHSAGITIVFGVPLPLNPRDNDPLPPRIDGIANALLAYRDGRQVGYYDKRLLPTYDVFDEDRYFVPGDRPSVIDVPCADGSTARVGLSICEDLWRGEDVGFAFRYARRADPVAELCAAQPDGKPGAQIIINPSASPFVLGKGQRHRDILARHASAQGVVVAAVNQVGGNDELVFDGHGAVFDPAGRLIAAAPGFVEHLLLCDVPVGGRGLATAPAPTDPLLAAPDEALLFDALTLGVRDYLRKTGFKSAVLGLSGGIDSAVTAVIAAAALGPSNVLGVSLPSRISSEGSKVDAHALAERLGLRCLDVPIEEVFDSFERALAPAFSGRTPDVTEENLQSRCRGTLLMALSNKFGHMLLTTGNKSELAVGYCTIYGDMNGGLAVLSDVTKEWVYRLARWMNANPARLNIAGLSRGPIPDDSISKPPSAELRPGQTDQDSLPPYPVLDEIIERYVERRQHPERIAREAGFDTATVARIVRLIDLSEFKRKQAALGLKVTGLAFGSGRRVPIAQRWRSERPNP